MRTLLLSALLLISTQIFAGKTNPTTDGGDGVNEVPKTNVEGYFKKEKVDFKEVKDLFRKNKRIDRLFTPKGKKPIRKKYTIA